MIMKDNSPPFTNLLIDGEFRPASNEKVFEVHNPYNGVLVGTAAAATKEDCRDAIESAGKAFANWEHSSFDLRRDIFLKAADILESERYRQKIADAVRDETAAAEHMMFFNTYSPAATLRDTASMVSELKGETLPSQFPGGYVLVQRRAIGVVLAISPWNAPVLLSVRAVAVPILCGNTVVLKCSEVTPRTQSLVAEALLEAGLPKGVLNFVCMDRQDAAELTREMIAHPLIRKINFTGSDVVGRVLASEAAKYLKPCVFELGGKAPVVVLDDADVDKAARAIVSSALIHSGQVCMSTERVIMQRGVSDALIPTIVEYMKAFRAGDARANPETLSSLFSEASAKRVTSLIKDAKASGAQLLLGDGERNGAVVQPHVILGSKPGMQIWDRETFGPVLTITVADTVDELVDLANTSDYSLAAAVWSENSRKALAVASRIRSGFTNVNGPTVHLEGMRHGGLGGASGYGHFDVENFTDKRTVVVHPDGPGQYPLVDF